jgi:hypothetical protein
MEHTAPSFQVFSINKNPFLIVQGIPLELLDRAHLIARKLEQGESITPIYKKSSKVDVDQLLQMLQLFDQKKTTAKTFLSTL